MKNRKWLGLLFVVCLLGTSLFAGCENELRFSGYCNNIHEGQVEHYVHHRARSGGDDVVIFDDGCCYQIFLIEVIDCNGQRVNDVRQCQDETYKLMGKDSDHAILVPSSFRGDVCGQGCCQKCQDSCNKCE